MTNSDASPNRTRRHAMAAGAVVALLVAVLGIFIATRHDESSVRGEGGGAVTAGQGMCVETYSLETLKNRAVAFDGTVRSTSGDEVRFAVNEWFKGGESRQITLKGASTLRGITSAGPSVSLERGTRLLVAGDGGFAWGCGFTQPYDAAVAARWRQAFS